MKQLQRVVVIGGLVILLTGCSGQEKVTITSLSGKETVEITDEVNMNQLDTENVELTEQKNINVNAFLQWVCQNSQCLFIKVLDEERIVAGNLVNERIQLSVYNIKEQQIEQIIQTDVTENVVLNYIVLSGSLIQFYDGNSYIVIDLNTGKTQINIENMMEFSNLKDPYITTLGLYTISPDGSTIFYVTFQGENSELQELHKKNLQTGEDVILETYNFETKEEKEIFRIAELQISSDGKRLFFYGSYYDKVENGISVGQSSFDCFYIDLQRPDQVPISLGNKKRQIYQDGMLFYEGEDYRTGDSRMGILTFLDNEKVNTREFQAANWKEMWNPTLSMSGDYVLGSIEENGIYFYSLYRIEDGKLCAQFQSKYLDDNITIMDKLNKIFIWDTEKGKVEEIPINL